MIFQQTCYFSTVLTLLLLEMVSVQPYVLQFSNKALCFSQSEGALYETVILNIYMLFAGWEVRIVKNRDRGLENAAHFQARGQNFSLYGPTISRQITYLFLAINWLTSGFTQLCH